MGKAGGGEGEVGERGSVAGKVDWEKPCPEGRFPLLNPQEVVINLAFLAH